MTYKILYQFPYYDLYFILKELTGYFGCCSVCIDANLPESIYALVPSAGHNV